jgi:phosphate:Na+ symporter
VFTPPLPLPPGRLPVPGTHELRRDRGDFDQMYSWTKRLEGEILGFATRLQSEPLEQEESQRLTQLLSAIRYAVHSSKQLKDIHHDLAEFSESEQSAKTTYLEHVHSVMTAFYGELYQLRSEGEPTLLFEDLVALFQHAHEWHDQLHQDIFGEIRSRRVDDADVSTLLNVNRQLLNSNLSLLMALSYFQLTGEQAESIARMPGLG